MSQDLLLIHTVLALSYSIHEYVNKPWLSLIHRLYTCVLYLAKLKGLWISQIPHSHSKFTPNYCLFFRVPNGSMKCFEEVWIYVSNSEITGSKIHVINGWVGAISPSHSMGWFFCYLNHMFGSIYNVYVCPTGKHRAGSLQVQFIIYTLVWGSMPFTIPVLWLTIVTPECCPHLLSDIQYEYLRISNCSTYIHVYTTDNLWPGVHIGRVILVGSNTVKVIKVTTLLCIR